ncbi:fumarate hydratase class II [Candidatus Blochmanniella floridana]|uniref:Fumarate hydratase class II n=1 Tax=Blochmanniella floridana TaxID=203907 RepID=FUMC_BLOFL|nr:RecName: Full=Fumarate hydratase class II; Short=Fumarase C; AltName: Full=Aerobic fumarase; AltName: Full=Iron-independent fumarase [Candidatus Blochmannia floridanus]CAD83439.1 fumarate hydratase class II [Candidatus Blochmannia floridanus]
MICNRLWGDQTESSLKFFNISTEKMPWELIKALAQIKRVSAQVNYDLKLLDYERSQAIIAAVDEILSGNHKNEFPLSVWQTGSGTQSNMNMNEVLANRANELLRKNQINIVVHPNDHVNKSQSSNDVFPSAMHIAAVVNLKTKLIPVIKLLQKTFLKKSIEFRNIIKIGRTHLQDAIPLTLGQEISGWDFMLKNNTNHIQSTILDLSALALGGTAVGTGFSAHVEYAERVVLGLSKLIHHSFFSAPNKFESLSTCDAIVYSHGTLKGLAISMMKIANDIRLLSSGPQCGLGELIIPANEPGSSIMPGKVNPTQCESMTMSCCQVMGNDLSISLGGSSGQLQLNTYRPLIIYNFLQSIRLLTDSIKNFHDYCIVGIRPKFKRIEKLLNKSLMLVTALSSHIGYDKSAQIAQTAYLNGITLKAASIQSGYVTEKQFDDWVCPENMIYPDM